MRGTVAAIERELVDRRFVQRYPTAATATWTACPRGEGAFLACTFWLADNQALVGRAATRPASCSSGCSTLRNDVGLLAEE